MHIVITGASSGIGAAIAEVFAPYAQKMFLVARNEHRLLALKEQLLVHHLNKLHIHTTSTDLSQKENLPILAKNILNYLDNQVDILVNNVGIFLPSSFPEPNTTLFEDSLRLNMLSIYYLTEFLCPSMIERKKGHIFNICSTASLKAYPNGMAYGTSKYALKGFSDNLRETLIPHRIKVTAVLPGPTWTPSWEGTNVNKNQLMQARDIALMMLTATQLSSEAVVEEIKMRPLFGNISTITN